MGEVACTAAAAVSSSSPVMEEEERYVQVASRFFRVKPAAGGGSTDMARTHYHFLDACFLCKKSISRDHDIFMYKGDAAFCGEECRQEQMSMDEALQAVARRHRVLRHHSPASVDRAAGTARHDVAVSEASREPPMMHRRPTITNLGAARTPVTAS